MGTEMEKLFTQDGDVKREFTEAEYAQHALDVTAAKKVSDDIKAKEDARNTILAKLGITAEEAAVLLG
jgi:hypothetical protein